MKFSYRIHRRLLVKRIFNCLVSNFHWHLKSSMMPKTLEFKDSFPKKQIKILSVPSIIGQYTNRSEMLGTFLRLCSICFSLQGRLMSHFFTKMNLCYFATKCKFQEQYSLKFISFLNWLRSWKTHILCTKKKKKKKKKKEQHKWGIEQNIVILYIFQLKESKFYLCLRSINECVFYMLEPLLILFSICFSFQVD